MTELEQKSKTPFSLTGDRFSRQLSRRRFVIGDIHGCCKTLCALVEDVLQLERGDVLFLLGDYIDRGPDSKGVLDYLLDMVSAGCDIRPLRGNHEEMALRAAEDPFIRKIWFANGGRETLQQFRVDSSAEIPWHYLSFMASLPRILTTDDYVLVHAGLDFRTDDPVTDTSAQFMLWERNWRVQPEKLAGKTLVCGHTITPLFDIRASLHEPVIFLDNGCFTRGESGYGNLVALNLDSRELLVQENCE